MFNKYKLSLLGLIIAVSPLGMLRADSIGVNFSGTANDGGPAGCTPCTLSAGDMAGVIAQGNWNNESGISGTAASLLNNLGVSTTATLSWTSGGTWGNGLAAANVGNTNAMLLNNYLDGGANGIAAALTLTNIPYALYDVYVYIQRDNCCAFSDYTVNGQTQRVVTSGTSAGPGFMLASSSGMGNYVHFSDLSGDLHLSANLDPADLRSAIDGIQVVQVFAPEPGSFLLLALASAALLGMRFRRFQNWLRLGVASRIKA